MESFVENKWKVQRDKRGLCKLKCVEYRMDVDMLYSYENAIDITIHSLRLDNLRCNFSVNVK